MSIVKAINYVNDNGGPEGLDMHGITKHQAIKLVRTAMTGKDPIKILAPHCSHGNHPNARYDRIQYHIGHQHPLTDEQLTTSEFLSY